MTLFVRPSARRAGRIIIAIQIALFAAVSTASADTIRVTVDRAIIWNRPSGVTVVLTQVNRGAILDVVRHLDEWYEIVLPRNLRVGQRTGFIRASQVTLDQVGPPSEEAQAILEGRPPVEPGGGPETTRPSTPRQSTQRTAPRRPRQRNAFIHLDAGYRLGVDDFVRTTQAFADRYAETGSNETNFGTGTGFQFDILAGSRIGRHAFGLGVDVSVYYRPDGPQITAHVPHPFYYGQLREATFTDNDLKGSEIGIHVPFIWMPQRRGALAFSVFGGPSFFHLTQDVVTDLRLNEQYPYDTVTITDTVSDQASGNAFGFHVGADASYYFSPSVGIGVTGRFSRAPIDFSGDDDTVDNSGHAGNAVISGGVRFRF